MVCKTRSEMYDKPLFLTRVEFSDDTYLFTEMDCDSIMEFTRQGAKHNSRQFINIENEDALKIFEELMQKENPAGLNEFKAFVNAGYVLFKKHQLRRYSE